MTFVVQFVEQRGDGAVGGAVSAPGVEAVEDGFPGAVTLGQVTPGAGVQDPRDGVDQGLWSLKGWPVLPLWYRSGNSGSIRVHC